MEASQNISSKKAPVSEAEEPVPRYWKGNGVGEAQELCSGSGKEGVNLEGPWKRRHDSDAVYYRGCCPDCNRRFRIPGTRKIRRHVPVNSEMKARNMGTRRAMSQTQVTCEHCYCTDDNSNGIPHRVCCNCGNRRAWREEPIPVMPWNPWPSIYREMYLPWPYPQTFD